MVWWFVLYFFKVFRQEIRGPRSNIWSNFGKFQKCKNNKIVIHLHALIIHFKPILNNESPKTDPRKSKNTKTITYVPPCRAPMESLDRLMSNQTCGSLGKGPEAAKRHFLLGPFWDPRERIQIYSKQNQAKLRQHIK